MFINNYSRRVIALIILLCLLCSISGCSRNSYSSSGASYTFTDSADENLQLVTMPGYDSIANGPNGIYYTAGNYLKYYDIQTGQHVFLCNKPGCRHMDETNRQIGQDCYAYMPNLSMSYGILNNEMKYYQGYLYMRQVSVDMQGTVEDAGWDIVRIDPDGSKRTVIVHGAQINMIFPHQGYIYFIDGNNEAARLYRVIVDGSKDKEEICPGQFSGFNFQTAAINNKIYTTSTLYTDPATGQNHYGVLASIDLMDFHVEIIQENLPKLNFTILDQTHLSQYDDQNTYILNLTDGSRQVLMNKPGIVTSSDSYFFWYGGPGDFIQDEIPMAVYDKNGQLIDEAVLKHGFRHFQAGIINDALYIYYNDPKEYADTERIYCFTISHGKIKEEIFNEMHPSQQPFNGYEWNSNDY